MRATFKTVFYVNASKEKNGIVPIMGRVTINGTIAQFSCKLTIAKSLWDAKANRAKGKSRDAQTVNFALDNIKAQIAKHYQRISDREAFVTAEMVRNAYQGIGTEYEMLLQAFDKENIDFSKRIGKDRAVGTHRNYSNIRNHLANFIKSHYKRNDISMGELTEDFILGYCLYLRHEIGLAQSTVCNYARPLKHIVSVAHFNGKIPRNPFAMFHLDSGMKERGYLTEEELKVFSSVDIKKPGMALSRDLFVFGCWTGISFIDIKNLTMDNVMERDGAMWISSRRQKTKVPFQVKLMDIPLQIIKRYESIRKGNALLPILNHQHVNNNLKRIAKMCGIDKNLSFHQSRHSFAVLALTYGMPIESVSKILGHTNIKTTQIYAKVTNTKLEHDISLFEERISGRFNL